MHTKVRTDDTLLGATGKSTKRSRAAVALLAVFIIVYSLLTLAPFYVLLVRSFVPTSQATTLWLWIPPAQQPSLESRLSDYSSQFNLDLRRFKQDFGITGYLDPSLTLRQVAEARGIDPGRFEEYFRPYLNYSGWMLALSGGKYLRSLLATVVVVTLSIVVSSFLSAATGSVLARFTRRWHVVVYNLYLLEAIIPPILIILPLYLLMTRLLGLRDSYLSLILLNIKGGALPTVLFCSYIATIPNEMRESVYIDGGNRPTYFFRVLLPLCKTVIASHMAIRLPRFWNELLTGLVFLSPERYTVVPLISSIAGRYTTNYQAIYAALALSVLPLVGMYLAFHKLFIRAQMAGAIKG